jgi:hypothetical protein
MTTPIQRLTRLLNEGARFMVILPGHTSIDLTPDVIAAMDDVHSQANEIRLLKSHGQREDSERDERFRG